MSKYLNLFKTKAEADAAVYDENNTPNVSYCEEDDSVKYTEKIIPSPLEATFVDLGLPSGLKWAKANLGAESETDPGLYFAWGETKGYAGDAGHEFSWKNYKWSVDGSSSNFSKYNSKGATLDLEDDAAHAKLGGSCRMPTITEIDELIANTTRTWTTNYKGTGVSGYIVKSKTNSNQIFMPAAGLYLNQSLSSFGSYGDYWSSSQYSGNSYYGYFLDFNSDRFYSNYNCARCYGFPVRAVCSE